MTDGRTWRSTVTWRPCSDFTDMLRRLISCRIIIIIIIIINMRRPAILTDFVPLKWHDLARHIPGHCGNKIRASVKLA